MEYNMSHKNRGYAVIFNHVHFERWESRPGTNVDCENLRQTLSGLHFNVIICKDYTKHEIHEEIKEVSSRDHSENDCIIIVILSHGFDDGDVCAADREYSVESLASFFTADKCPSLAGKPKLFFIQACRGELNDIGARIAYPKGVHNVQKQCGIDYQRKLPVQADFLFAYSSVPGYVSYRHITHGSWYVQTLCEQLKINGTLYDLMKLLTIVNHKVAVKFPTDAETTFKQMPYFNTSLTKFVTFTDNKNDAGLIKGLQDKAYSMVASVLSRK